MFERNTIREDTLTHSSSTVKYRHERRLLDCFRVLVVLVKSKCITHLYAFLRRLRPYTVDSAGMMELFDGFPKEWRV